jgi:hypothetical protein
MEKVRGRVKRSSRTDSPLIDEAEVERSFWISRSDGLVINRKTKHIVLLEFKRTSNCGEDYFQDMWRVTDKRYTPIRTGLRTMVAERGWEVEVVPLVVGQWSVREKEWFEALRTFGIGKEDGKRVIDRLGYTLFNEHEKFFDNYWCHTFGTSSSLLQLLGKDISVRVSQPPQSGEVKVEGTSKLWGVPHCRVFVVLSIYSELV